MARLSIRVLGPLEVGLDGEPVSGFVSDKVRALLVYLALSADRPHRREALAGLLWPEFPERSARANLRNALASVRHAIGDGVASPPFLRISRQTIQFNGASDYWLDVRAFQELVSKVPPTREGLEEAVSLARGDCFEGFSLADAAPFEEWLLLRREQHRRQLVEALDRLCVLYVEQGSYDNALVHARRRVELEPWQEDGQARLMHLLAGTGHSAEALAHYETYRRVLAEGLGVEPEPATSKLADRIRKGDLRGPSSWQAPAAPEEPAARLPRFLQHDAPAVEAPVFVARERQLARLGSLLDSALGGKGQVVFVTGGPGRGKTALLTEFARRAMEDHPRLLVAGGSCTAYSGAGDPYLPFRDIFGRLTGDVEAGWSAGTVSRKHALRLWQSLPVVAHLFADHGPHMVPAMVPGPALLARIRAAMPAGAPWLERLVERIERQPGDSPRLEQSALFQQVSHVLRALAREHPLLLILDDLQWADTASAHLLFHLGRRLEGSRILIAGLYRPEEVALGRDGEQHPLEPVLAELKRVFGDIWLDLTKVPQPEARLFVDALLDTEPNRLGEGFRRALFRHTDGHPLLTVELLRSMQERGDLVRDQGGPWVEGPLLRWDLLPAKVEGVIEARIGRLGDELRDILSVASVEGEEFTAQVVAQVLGADERRMLRWLSAELERRHRLVREQPALQVGDRLLARYVFAHALFQEHLYAELGDGEKALLHGAVARALESLYQDRLGDAAVRLARHYSEAGDLERALKYLVMAGDAALASYAHKEAEDYYRRGLTLTPGEPEQAHLLRGLGEALHGLSRFDEAIRAWGEGIERYRALGDWDGVARLYARSAWTAYQANDPAESLRLCLEGLEQVADAPESPGLVHLLHGTARAYGLNARLDEGRVFAEQALSMSERLRDVEAQAHALATLGGFYLQGEPAIEVLERAVELAESRALLGAASRAHNNLGTILSVYQGRLQTGGEHYRRAAELERQAGRTARQLFYLANVVTNLLRVGKLRQAELVLSEARGLLRDVTERTWGTQQILAVELEHLLCRGEWTACAQKARVIRQAALREGRDLDGAHAGLMLGWAVLESRRLAQDTTAGTWEEAGEALTRTVEIYDGSRYHHLRIAARMRLAGLFIQQGRIGDARQKLAESEEVIRPLPAAPRMESQVLWLAAWVASAERRWAEAEVGFEGAAAMLGRLGMRWAWARSLLDWALFRAARGEPGDRDRAVELLRRSQEAFEEMESPGYVAVVQRLLLDLTSKKAKPSPSAE